MSAPRKIVELELREPTAAQSAEDLRIELYLSELRTGPPFPLWRLVRGGRSLREYAEADRLECIRLEIELDGLLWRWWKTESCADVLDTRRRMVEIDAALEARSVGVWVRSSGGRLYLLEGRTL